MRSSGSSLFKKMTKRRHELKENEALGESWTTLEMIEAMLLTMMATRTDDTKTLITSFSNCIVLNEKFGVTSRPARAFIVVKQRSKYYFALLLRWGAISFSLLRRTGAGYHFS